MFYRKHPRVAFSCGDQMLTKQEHKDECDIHRIIKQYQRTGVITHVQSKRAEYTDLPDSLDFQESLLIIQEAETAFFNLPASVRAHFVNDPSRFLAAFNDPAQYDYLREVGLVRPSTTHPDAPLAASNTNTAPPPAGAAAAVL